MKHYQKKISIFFLFSFISCPVLVETLSEKDINAIGHAFGYYEYAQGEKGLVSAYSSKDAVVSYINGYVEMVLQAGMLYTTGPQQEAFMPISAVMKKWD